MAKHIRRGNATRSAIHACVEHVFGHDLDNRLIGYDIGIRQYLLVALQAQLHFLRRLHRPQLLPTREEYFFLVHEIIDGCTDREE